MVTRKTTLGVAVLAAAALALTGCAGGAKTTPGGSAGADLNNLATTTPAGDKPVDLVKWNLPYEPMSLDPQFTFNYAENTVDANLCESLVRMTPDLKTEPGLATKVAQPDAMTVVYTIRDGVTFWDGKPLTAEDVAYSLERQVGANTKSYFADYFRNVDSATATGPMEVTVKMKQPDVLFAQSMASAAGAIVEKAAAVADGDKFGTPNGNLQCTGPFSLTKWNSGKSIETAKNPNYWDKTLTPKVAKMSFSFIADESTAVNALRTGDVDGQFFYLPPAGLSQLKNTKTVTTTYGKSFVFWTLAAINKDGVLGNQKIRQALSLAIDRSALAKVVFQGAAIAAPTLVGPDTWGYQKDAFQKAYAKFDTKPDLAKAKQLVADAGSPKDPIVLAVQGSSAVHEQTANLIQAAGQAIGLNVQTKVIPVEQFGNIYFDPNARKGLDGFFTTNYADFADPLDVYSFFQTGNSHDYIDWNGADDEIKQALQTTDEQKRADLVTKIQDKVTSGLPWIPLEFEPTTLIQNTRISGATASFAYLYGPWAATIGGTK